MQAKHAGAIRHLGESEYAVATWIGGSSWSHRVVAADDSVSVFGLADSEPLSGGFNLTTYAGFYDGAVAAPHNRVHAFYHGTIDPKSIGSTIDGTYIDPKWYANDESKTTGYVYSRLGGATARDTLSNACRQDPSKLEPSLACQSTRRNVDYADSSPGTGDVHVDEPPKSFFGGAPSGTAVPSTTRSLGDPRGPDITSIAVQKTSYPGFRLPPRIEFAWVGNTRDFYAELDQYATFFETHLNFVGTEKTLLVFNVRTLYKASNASAAKLTVSFNGTTIGSFTTLDVSSGVRTIVMDISLFRGSSGTFRFQLSGTDNVLSIDNIALN